MKQKPKYQGQLSGYVIEQTIGTYLEDRYKGSWTLSKHATVTPAPPALLIKSVREGRGGCTMTALTSFFLWLKNKLSLNELPEKPEDMYRKISQAASGHGFRPESGRTNPFRLALIIRRIWCQINVPGKAKSYLMARQRRFVLYGDQNLPLLLNIAFGYYKFHTVTVTSYQLWQRKTAGRKKQRLLLEVHDGWTTLPRYLDVWAMRHPFSGHFTFYSLTAAWPD